MSLSNAVVSQRPRGLFGLGSRAAAQPLRASKVFAHVGLFTCLILQRFAIPVGATGQLSISLPVFWGLTLWMLLSKRGRFAAGRGFLFLLFLSWTLVSAVTALLYPDPRVGFSLLSMINVMFLYLPLNVRPMPDFDGRDIRDTFLFYIRICAVLGILQFALQFVHIRLFFVPRNHALHGPVPVGQELRLEPAPGVRLHHPAGQWLFPA